MSEGNTPQPVNVDVTILNIKLKQLEVKDQVDSDEFNRKNKLEVINIDKEKSTVEIKLTEDISGTFNIHLVLTGTYEVHPEDKEHDIDFDLFASGDSLDDLGFPLLSEASQIISIITGKIKTIPLIIPPIIEKD